MRIYRYKAENQHPAAGRRRKKLKAKNLLNGEKPTIAGAQESISDILNNEAPPELTVEKLLTRLRVPSA